MKRMFYVSKYYGNFPDLTRDKFVLKRTVTELATLKLLALRDLQWLFSFHKLLSTIAGTQHLIFKKCARKVIHISAMLLKLSIYEISPR